MQNVPAGCSNSRQEIRLSDTAHQIRILLVEDSLEESLLMQALVEREGLGEVLAVQDGLSGAERVKDGAFHLIICDLNLPGFDGIGVVRASKRAHPDRPIIVTTGYHDPELHSRARAGGADRVFTKPIDRDSFLEALKSLLDGIAEKAEQAEAAVPVSHEITEPNQVPVDLRSDVEASAETYEDVDDPEAMRDLVMDDPSVPSVGDLGELRLVDVGDVEQDSACAPDSQPHPDPETPLGVENSQPHPDPETPVSVEGSHPDPETPLSVEDSHPDPETPLSVEDSQPHPDPETPLSVEDSPIPSSAETHVVRQTSVPRVSEEHVSIQVDDLIVDMGGRNGSGPPSQPMDDLADAHPDRSGPHTVLAVGAFPGDVILGCGGILAGHAKDGWKVVIVSLTRRFGSLPDLGGAAHQAARRLGAKLVLGDVQPGDDERARDLVRSLIELHGPDTVLLPSPHDRDGARVDAHDAVVEVTPASCHVYAYQTPSSGLAFRPNLFASVEKVLDEKVRALEPFAEYEELDHLTADNARTSALYWGRHAKHERVEPLEMIWSPRETTAPAPEDSNPALAMEDPDLSAATAEPGRLVHEVAEASAVAAEAPATPVKAPAQAPIAPATAPAALADATATPAKALAEAPAQAPIAPAPEADVIPIRRATAPQENGARSQAPTQSEVRLTSNGNGDAPEPAAAPQDVAIAEPTAGTAPFEGKAASEVDDEPGEPVWETLEFE